MHHRLSHLVRVALPLIVLAAAGLVAEAGLRWN
jgi:hypothetical protein